MQISSYNHKLSEAILRIETGSATGQQAAEEQGRKHRQRSSQWHSSSRGKGQGHSEAQVQGEQGRGREIYRGEDAIA